MVGKAESSGELLKGLALSQAKACRPFAACCALGIPLVPKASPYLFPNPSRKTAQFTDGKVRLRESDCLRPAAGSREARAQPRSPEPWLRHPLPPQASDCKTGQPVKPLEADTSLSEPARAPWSPLAPLTGKPQTRAQMEGGGHPSPQTQTWV